MELINTLNLSDIMGFFENEEDLNKLIRSMESDNYPSFNRIYIGSYFCSRYYTYLGIKYYKNILDFARNAGYKVTLSIPIINEGNLDNAINRTKELETYFDVIDEITVNDYGMLVYISEKYKDKKINIGRLLNKDTRDIRYLEFTNRLTIPDNLTYDKVVGDDIKINSLEIDVTHLNIDLNNTNYIIGIHVPYLYQTYGNVCEYASIEKADEFKFRPNAICSFECHRTHIEYKGEKFSYIKHGRCVFTKIPMPNIYNKDSVRMIFFPLDYLERGKNE